MAVLNSVYDEFQYIMNLEEFDRDIADIPSFYQDSGGEFWVLDLDGVIAGTVGARPEDHETCELRRLYLLNSCRGKGYGRALLKTMLVWSRENGFRRIFLWSDVLFERAHVVYTASGFEPTEKTRAADPANPTSVERCFVKAID
jgi:N-acetylglutamate synthase-like GNAT family acetyltransferase